MKVSQRVKYIPYFVAWLFAAGAVFAEDFFVDYESGDDNGTIWKHAPGDPAATGNPKNAVLRPGDRVLFKGGVVYRGQIQIKNDGVKGNPIVYKGDGWGAEKAVIDGSGLVAATWTKCANQAEAGGNPHWQNIWTCLSSAEADHPTAANMTENDQLLWVAQWPNPKDPFFSDDDRDYAQADAISSSTMTDSRLDSLGGDSLVGAYIYTQESGANVYFHRITAYASSSHTLTFTAGSYADQGGKYALMDYVGFIDAPGEYVHNPDPGVGGLHRIYLWPRSADPNRARITISERGTAIDLTNRSHLVIEGFRIRNHGSSGFNDVVQATTLGQGKRTADLTIRNNDITNNSWTRFAAMSLSVNSCVGVVIEDNAVWNNRFLHGIYIIDCENVMVRRNKIGKNGGSPISFRTTTFGAMIDNTAEATFGSHANGLMAYENKGILIARNLVVGGNTGLSIQLNENMIIYNNLFIKDNGDAFIVAQWRPTKGNNIFAHNTVYGNMNMSVILSLDQTSGATDMWYEVNNIIDGDCSYQGGRDTKHTYNLYTHLRGYQQPGDGWVKGQGEVLDSAGSNYIPIDAATVFKDPTNVDILGDECGFTLKPNSRAIDAGTNFLTFINTLSQSDTAIKALVRAFPDFDWTVDLAGNKRGEHGAWDIGAYEYCVDAAVLPYSADRQPTGNATFRFHGVGFDVSLSAPVGVAELTIVNLAGRVVFHAPLSAVQTTTGARYECAWRAAPSAGAYIAIIKVASRNESVVTSARKFVVVR
jgi:hypothetical protein